MKTNMKTTMKINMKTHKKKHNKKHKKTNNKTNNKITTKTPKKIHKKTNKKKYKINKKLNNKKIFKTKKHKRYKVLKNKANPKKIHKVNNKDVLYKLKKTYQTGGDPDIEKFKEIMKLNKNNKHQHFLGAVAVPYLDPETKKLKYYKKGLLFKDEEDNYYVYGILTSDGKYKNDNKEDENYNTTTDNNTNIIKYKKIVGSTKTNLCIYLLREYTILSFYEIIPYIKILIDQKTNSFYRLLFSLNPDSNISQNEFYKYLYTYPVKDNCKEILEGRNKVPLTLALYFEFLNRYTDCIFKEKLKDFVDYSKFKCDILKEKTKTYKNEITEYQKKIDLKQEELKNYQEKCTAISLS